MSISLNQRPQVAPHLYRNPLDSSSNGKPPSATAKPGAQALEDGRIEGGRPSSDGVDSLFQEQFAAAASDPEAFHETMRTAFGDAYDVGQAEALRQKALAGDFSWLPRVEYVGADVLGGANGAYDKQAGVVYLNEALRGSELAAQTFVEEAGHHIDTLINKSDAAGDEGELFRRILGGESLSQAQIQEVKAENDMGTITVDGREVQVEFWNPFKAIGKAVSGAAKAVGKAVSGAAKAVGNAVSGAAKAVGQAVGKAATGVWNGIKTVGETVFDTVKTIGKGIGGAVWGTLKGIGGGIWNFGKNLFQGHIVDAFGALGEGFLDAGRAVLDGADKIFLQAPQRLANGLINGAQEVFSGATELLGPLGKYVRFVSDRVFDAGRTATNMTFGTLRDVARAPFELGMDFVQDLGRSAGHLFKGEFGQAAKSFGGAFLNLGKGVAGRGLDVLMRNVQGLTDIVELAAGREPSRPLSEVLTPDQMAEMRAIYGDSIDFDLVRVKQGSWTHDLGMAAHVVGNTVYLPNSDFNADGSLTSSGFDTAIHEMGHVWQNQNGGGDYIHEALWANAVASVETGNRNNAYNWRLAVAEGKSFAQMNPEQQADLIEQAALALRDDGRITADDWASISQPGDSPMRFALSDQELAVVLDALESVRAGVGAP